MVYELNKILKDGRIDKILQPEYDEIILAVRAGGKNHKLAISASSSNPRIHITSVQKENPMKAPMFCMLLRKHILNGKIVKFYQPDFERIIEIHIESRDEMGDISVKKIIAEIMGRTSNIVLTNASGHILGSIKHVDFSVSSVRQLIPGMLYEMPPSQGKLNPLDTDENMFLDKINAYNLQSDKFLLDTFTGIGPMSAREISYRALGVSDADCGTLSVSKKDKFAEYFTGFFNNIKNGKYSPMLIYKSKSNVKDFSPVNITHYENIFETKKFRSLNDALDEYYITKDFKERMSQKTSGLIKFIDTNLQRCNKKIALQKQKIDECKNKEKFKIFGDLITVNLHRINENDVFIEAENYYSNMEVIKIELSPELSPSQNAQKYYKKYQKLKSAEVETKKQIKLAEEEIDYLESVKENLLMAESEHDINEIREELYSQGYHVKKNVKSKMQKQISKPLEFQLSDGYKAYVGKNNMQNDELTLRQSKSNDLWFHTKFIHGSHTVVKTNGVMPSDDVIVEAAKICAYYSKARNSANVPVDYTIIKNVKKPNGAKPGMVIYDNYKTVNVKPELPGKAENN